MSAPPHRPLPALHRLLPGVYYGWPIAFGTSLLSFVVVGIGFYGVAVFLPALSDEHGWSRTSVSFATTLYFATTALAGTWIGRSVDRSGARGWIAAGACVMAVSLLALGRLETPAQLYLCYVLLAIGFSMTGGLPTNAIISRWFEARRARAMSIAHTGVSVGGVVLVPVMTGLIVQGGLELATRFLAVLVLLVVLPIVAFVLRGDPAEHGLAPDGVVRAASPDPQLPPAAAAPRWTARQALATRTFWVLVTAFGGILFCQVATAMHQVALLQEHLEPSRAALGVSATAFGSIVARLVVGAFADRVSKRRLGVGLIAVQATALVTFGLAQSAPPLFAASLLFGFTIGNLFMLQALIVAELFGVASFGTVLGLLQLLTQAASGLGPLALGLLYEGFGSYREAMLLLAAIALASAGALSRLRPPPSR